jgi:hypothetical protein
MRATIIGTFLVVFSLLGFTDTFGGESAFTLGYGSGVGNGSGNGRIENGLRYNFAQLSYVYERPLIKRVILGLEPLANIDNKPNSGLDIGGTAYFKFYLSREATAGLYCTAGAGGAYTSVKFPEQGTHTPFILQGGLGYRQGRIFLEARFFHYSNGGLEKPNRSVNSNIAMIGYYF